MADIHVLASDKRGRITVALHIPVPSGNNTVGIPWQTAIINSGVGGSTRLPTHVNDDGVNGTITQAEKNSIEAGTVYEHVVTNTLDSGGDSIANRRATLRSLSVREKAAAIKGIQDRLKYFGHTESEA